MADLATMLHHPHPQVRSAAGLAHSLRQRLSGERIKRETVKTRGVHTAEAFGAAALLAAADHYLGGADGELAIGPVPVGLGLGVLVSGAAFLFGGEDGWADHASAVGDAWIAAGTYGCVRTMLQSSAGGQ